MVRRRETRKTSTKRETLNKRREVSLTNLSEYEKNRILEHISSAKMSLGRFSQTKEKNEMKLAKLHMTKIMDLVHDKDLDEELKNDIEEIYSKVAK